jgi:DNA replication protein DnaC
MLQAIGHFLNINAVFKDAAKKFIPLLAERDDFEVEYKYKLPCPGCGNETASGLFYRITNQYDWLQAGETMKCSICRDEEAFKIYQNKSLEELRSLVGKRLTNDYFLLPEGLKKAGFNNYEETNKVTAGAKGKAVLYTKTFLASEDGRHNLLITGNPGTGKTKLCVAIARNIKEKGFIVGFLTTGELLSMIKATYQKGAAKTETEILKDIKRLDCLILDDLGSEASSGNNDWKLKTIFEIVNSRSGKPTIYTSNLTEEDLVNAVGSRVFSRLYDNTKFIDLFTDDYRKNLIKK